MVSLLRRYSVRRFRIHVAGDFYSAAYIKKWTEIVTRSRRVQFFTYTRSWRRPRLLPWLLKLAVEPNISLWWSADAATGRPPRYRDIAGIAYLSTSDTDLEPTYRVDLIFRDVDYTPIKFTPRGALVCPYDQGVQREEQITCERCSVCLTKVQGPPPRRGR